MLGYERGAGHGPVEDHFWPARVRWLGPGRGRPPAQVARAIRPYVRESPRADDRFRRPRLGWRIAVAGQEGGFNTGLAAYGKLFRGTYSPVRARLGVEIGGAGAMTWEPGSADRLDLAMAFFDSKAIAIAGGTNENQRNGIGERILGMPREISSTAGLRSTKCSATRGMGSASALTP